MIKPDQPHQNPGYEAGAEDGLNLRGQLLIAMPAMTGGPFNRAVVLVCAHSDDGAMGFVLNHRVTSPTFNDIIDELDMATDAFLTAPSGEEIDVFSGGPVEQGRGFVIHSLDYATPATTRVKDLAGVTATLDALHALTRPHAPNHSILALGYSGWSAGQLEQELAQNAWLTVPATSQLVFETDYALQYTQALAMLGVTEALLSSQAGHA